MIKKFRFGTPIETGAVISEIKEQDLTNLTEFNFKNEGVLEFNLQLKKLDIVYGLGEQIRGINKRGWIYTSYNEDNAVITETRTSLYGSHNFIVVDGQVKFGAFFDFADKVVFDIGYTDSNMMKVTCRGDGYLYIVNGENAYQIIKEFRSIIGQSYIPPKWAFGIGQSRWGYASIEDFEKVISSYEENDFPLDMVYMDIDYMTEYEDFTINESRFPDFDNFVKKVKERGIRLVPIVDTGIKVKNDYDVYLEGFEKNAYCVDKSGKPFVVGVWPGDSVLPDVLNKESAKWFGSKYYDYLDKGIEGFWNDMNEPAIFYSKKRLNASLTKFKKVKPDMPREEFEAMRDIISSYQNNVEDYKDFYHNIDGKLVSHDKVHNLYGYKLTQCSADYLKEYNSEKRYLLFSRSSYIGMHRSAGIWTGDNASWWSHLLLNFQMLPSLNMCGFLYVGADVGGFGSNTTQDLLLRWMAVACFTPLYRNHSPWDTREQEPYQFSATDKFRQLMQTRYALLPFIYSEYVKCALNSDMLFKPLAFCFPNDKRAPFIEDQLMMGDAIMLAPVYQQNSVGRYVYLPEDMLEVRFTNAGIKTKERKNGNHFIKVALDQVVVFLRKGKVLPIAKPCKRAMDVDFKDVTFIKNIDSETVYTMCMDDGIKADDLRKYLVDIVVKP